MKARHLALAPTLGALATLAGCGPSGEKAAGIVEAASKTASEAVQKLDLSAFTPETAKAEASKLVSAAAAQLASIRDSATAENISKELQPLLDQVAQLGTLLKDRLDLGALQKTVEDLITKFKNDPRVQATLNALLEKIHRLSGSGSGY